MGSGPFKFAGYEIGQSIKGERNPDYYHKGLPYLDGFVGIFAPKQAIRVDAIRADRAAIEFRGLPPSARDELVQGARRQDHGAGQRLELRQRRHAQPQEEAVRRRARAPGADAGDRPWNGAPALSKIANVQHRRRHRLPGLAAGGDQGGAAEDRRLLARHREVARRGQAAAEGGRRRGPEVRAAQPQRRPALQVRRHLADRRVEQDRPQGRRRRWCRPARGLEAMRTGDFDVDRRGQLPERGQPAARHRQVPAAHGLSPRTTATTTTQKEIELYEQDAARDRPGEAARADARSSRSTCSTRRRTRS